MKRILVKAVALALLVGSLDAHADDLFLCIADRGFQGDVTVNGYEGCSRVSLVLESMRLDGRRVSPSPWRLTKPLDSMSQAIATAMVDNREIQEARVVRRIALGPLGFGEGFASQEIRFLGSRITEYGLSSESDDGFVISEQLAFAPLRIEWITRRPAGGGTFQVTSVCWDVMRNVVTLAC